MSNTPNFCVTDGKGFHITFVNGWTVSVQFGPGNYCDNYNSRFDENARRRCGEQGSSTAECAVWGGDGNMVRHFDGETVSNRSTPAEVLELLNWAAAQPRIETEKL